jgi:hypothetical protein
MLFNSPPGLPDGIFSYQKSEFGYILNGLGMENSGIGILRPFGVFYGHMVVLWPFGIFYGHLVFLWSIWYVLRPFGNFMAIWYTF